MQHVNSTNRNWFQKQVRNLGSMRYWRSSKLVAYWMNFVGLSTAEAALDFSAVPSSLAATAGGRMDLPGFCGVNWARFLPPSTQSSMPAHAECKVQDVWWPNPLPMAYMVSLDLNLLCLFWCDIESAFSRYIVQQRADIPPSLHPTLRSVLHMEYFDNLTIAHSLAKTFVDQLYMRDDGFRHHRFSMPTKWREKVRV